MSSDSVKYGIYADAAKAVSEHEKVIRQQEKMIATLRGTAGESKKTATAAGEINKNFGAVHSTMQKAGTMMAGFITAGAGLAGVRKLLGAIKEEATGATTAIATSTDAIKSLIQVSRSWQEYQALESTAKRIAARHGDLKGARDLAFTASSEGLLEDVDFFAELGRIVDPQKMVSSVKTVQTAFGKKEAGTSRQIVNKLLEAARVSRMRTPEFATQLAQFAADAARGGYTDESAMATFAQMAFATKSPEQAATKMKAWAVQSIKGGFAAPTYPESYAKFQALSEKERRKWMQESEFAGAHEILGKIRAESRRTELRLGEIQAAAGTPESEVNRRLGIWGRSTLAPQEQAAAAKARREIADERFAAPQFRREALIDYILANEANRRGVFTRTAMKTVGAGAKNLPLPDWAATLATRGSELNPHLRLADWVAAGARGGPAGLWNAASGDVADVLREIKDVLSRIDRKGDRRDARSGAEQGSPGME